MSANDSEVFDLAIIGAGVNGAGIARDAAGRGLKVLICEKDDIAQATSSSSTKLVHGGLRYLEYYDFALVRHALGEREVLMRAAPHIIWPLRFILPHHKELRPRWLIRTGLFLYDNLGGRKLLPRSNGVNLETHVSGQALKDEFTRGFEYSDCWVQDSRLVTLNVMDAAARGADVRNLDEEHDDDSPGVRLVKGSHIVVKKLFEHPYTYIFQNADNRIIFAVPYENEYTLLGTTDVEIEAEPGTEQITEEEISYICDSASEYFKTPIKPADVVWTYTGVRPLYDDASENASKVITTFRKLSEEAVDMLAGPMGFSGKAWTAPVPLPGGDIPNADFDGFLGQCQSRYDWMEAAVLLDYARNYGTRIHQLIGEADSMEALGMHFGGPLYEAEIRYLVEHEYARPARKACIHRQVPANEFSNGWNHITTFSRSKRHCDKCPEAE